MRGAKKASRLNRLTREADRVKAAMMDLQVDLCPCVSLGCHCRVPPGGDEVLKGGCQKNYGAEVMETFWSEDFCSLTDKVVGIK